MNYQIPPNNPYFFMPPYYPFYQDNQANKKEEITENIITVLKLNIGKQLSVYMTFENTQWSNKVFKGVLAGVGTDHFILLDADKKIRYLLLLKNLSYITFEEEINYFASE